MCGFQEFLWLIPNRIDALQACHSREKYIAFISLESGEINSLSSEHLSQ